MRTKEEETGEAKVTTDRMGRQQRSDEERRQLMAESQSSGMSRMEFARQRGIKYKTLNEWFARAERRTKVKARKKVVLKPLDTKPLFFSGKSDGVVVEVVMGQTTVKVHPGCGMGYLKELLGILR